MGLSHYPSAADGMLPVLVMNTVISVALLKNLLKWVLQIMVKIQNPSNFEEDGEDGIGNEGFSMNSSETKSISVTLFKSLSSRRRRNGESGGGGEWWSMVECCVCLHKFEGDEEVSELLSCKHFFHKGCLQKWLDHKNTSCPLCRSTTL